VKHAYQALEPDELSLDLGDVVNVSRKMVDGEFSKVPGVSIFQTMFDI
jgi:hypothetical protein